jgi:hypothetical protein
MGERVGQRDRPAHGVSDQVGPACPHRVEEAAEHLGEGVDVAGADVLGRLAVAGQVQGVHPSLLGQLLGGEQPVVQVAAEAV